MWLRIRRAGLGDANGRPAERGDGETRLVAAGAAGEQPAPSIPRISPQKTSAEPLCEGRGGFHSRECWAALITSRKECRSPPEMAAAPPQPHQEERRLLVGFKAVKLSAPLVPWVLSATGGWRQHTEAIVFLSLLLSCPSLAPSRNHLRSPLL